MELSDNQKEEILRKFEKNEKKSWKKGRKNLKTSSKKEQHVLLKKSSVSLDTNKVKIHNLFKTKLNKLHRK